MLNVHLYSIEHYTHYCSTLCCLQWNELYSLSNFHLCFATVFFLCCWCCKCIFNNPLCNILDLFFPAITILDVPFGFGICVDRGMAHSFIAHGVQHFCICPFGSAKRKTNFWISIGNPQFVVRQSAYFAPTISFSFLFRSPFFREKNGHE